MHEASALVAGATLAAAEAVWRGEATAGGQHRRRAAPRDARPGVRLLRLQRPGGGHRPPARPRAPSGSPTSTSTCTTATACRRSSTTTRGCSRSACTRRRWRCSPAPGSRDETGGPRRRGQRGQRRAAARHRRRAAGCARSTRWCRRCCGRSGRSCCSPSAAPTAHRLDPLADLRLTVDGQRAALPGAARPRRRALRRPLGGHRRRRVRAGRGGARGPGPTCSPMATGDAAGPGRRSTPPALARAGRAPGARGRRRCRCG